VTIFAIEVGVALRRPPTVDEWRRVDVEAASLVEAKLIACQVAACTSVMPVEARCGHLAPQREIGTARVLCRDCDEVLPLTLREWYDAVAGPVLHSLFPDAP